MHVAHTVSIVTGTRNMLSPPTWKVMLPRYQSTIPFKGCLLSTSSWHREEAGGKTLAAKTSSKKKKEMIIKFFLHC